MMQYQIWWSRALNNIAEIVRACNREDYTQSFRHMVSAYRSTLSLIDLEGHILKEPKKLSDRQYLHFALRECEKQKISLFIPYWYRGTISRHQAAFSAIGTKIMVAGSVEALSLIANKRKFYEDLSRTTLPLPAWQSYQCATSFKKAIENMPLAEAGYCVKPSISIFGKGFARLRGTAGSFQDKELNKQNAISIEDHTEYLKRFPCKQDMLLMAYLPGLERSIDCLAHNGKLIRSISRLKVSHSAQHLETEGIAINVAQQLIERYNLSGIINIQTRDDAAGQPRILEINTRISGGIHYTFPSGLILPFWAASLALGLCSLDDIPYPQSLTIFKNNLGDYQAKKAIQYA